MGAKNSDSLRDACGNLAQALELSEEQFKNRNLHFLLITKAFENLVEYGWKELKVRVEDEGLEAQSPKEAVRAAAKLGFIKDPQLWIDCVNARNNSVHDYFGLPPESYVKLAEKFLMAVQELSQRKTPPTAA